MSNNIPEWYINAYKEGVYHLVQQKGSRFQDKVRLETQKGETDFFDVIGKTVAQKKRGRNVPTPRIHPEHFRRAVSTEPYNWSVSIDKQDKLKLLNDPTAAYTTEAVWAMGRSKDDVIIEAFGGAAYGGNKGQEKIVFPHAQRVAAVKSGALANLNIDTLREVSFMLNSADVDPDAERFFAITASQLKSLLSQTEVTSADYANVKALVDGKVDTFMGFTFVNSQRLLFNDSNNPNYNDGSKFDLTTGAYSSSGTLSSGRLCYAWVKDGMILSTAEEMVVRVDELPTQCYDTQIYVEMNIGATRMEEAKVVEVHCAE